MHDLSVLNQRFAALGFTRKPVRYHAAELLFQTTLALGGIVAFVMADEAVMKAGALLVITLGNLGLTNFGHSASHNGIS